MKLQSKFALLDVMQGRRQLEKALKSTGKPIPVTVDAEIVRVWGNDDGTSQEFELSVKAVRVETKMPERADG